MAATRDGLEAVIRKQITRCVDGALMAGTPSTGIMNRATETILGAAEEYGLAEYGITAARRAELARAVADVIHYGDTIQACGSATVQAPALATDPAKVNCRRCKGTRAYRAALREAS